MRSLVALSYLGGPAFKLIVNGRNDHQMHYKARTTKDGSLLLYPIADM